MPAQFCPYCGTSLNGIDAAYCPRCGRQLPAVAPDATGPAMPQPVGPAAVASSQQQPAWSQQPVPGMYAPPPAQPYVGYQAAPPAYAAPAPEAYAPMGAGRAAQYALPASATPVAAGGAIGVTAAVATIAFLLVLLTGFSLASRLIGLRFVFYLANYGVTTLGISAAWALATAFWLAIARLPRFSWWQVVSECAAVCLVAVLLLPVVGDLIAIPLIGNRAIVLPFAWLTQMSAIKLVLIVIFAAASAFTAAGLAAGFAGWPRLRAARIPVSPTASLLLPIGVAAGVFLCSEVLLIGIESRVGFTFYLDALLTFLFIALPVAVLPIAGGMITYASLRDKLRPPAAMPASPPIQAVPPSGPR